MKYAISSVSVPAMVGVDSDPSKTLFIRVLLAIAITIAIDTSQDQSLVELCFRLDAYICLHLSTE